MAISSTRTVIHGFTSDLQFSQSFDAAANVASPGLIEPVILAIGNNTITVPTGATAVTILPPTGNTSVLTVKGIAGDTGIAIHLTDPTSIGLATTVTTFVINASVSITARLIFS
jgi:hypothetical protein